MNDIAIKKKMSVCRGRMTCKRTAGYWEWDKFVINPHKPKSHLALSVSKQRKGENPNNSCYPASDSPENWHNHKDKTMKFTIETREFKADTESVAMARRLIDIIDNQPVPEISAILKMETAEIPDDTYLTITADDITCGGKSVTEYNGNKIWARDDCMEYITDADKEFQQEHGARLVALHVVQANNMFDKPIPDPNGLYCWCRCVFDVNGQRKVSRWVFRIAYSSVADCRSYCANVCGNSVRYDSAFRAGLFGSLGN